MHRQTPCVPRRGSDSTYTQETLDSQAAQTRHFAAQIADKDCVGEWKKLTTRQTPTVAVLIISPLLHPRQEQRPVVSEVSAPPFIHAPAVVLDKNPLLAPVIIATGSSIIFISMLVYYFFYVRGELPFNNLSQTIYRCFFFLYYICNETKP